jgi:hypothetical protein
MKTNTDAFDLIDEVLNEMAPLYEPTTSTPVTTLVIRNIIREALLKYDSKKEKTQ